MILTRSRHAQILARLQYLGAAALAATLLLTSSTAGQQPSKRALTHEDYDSWRTIQSQRLSRDGRFLAYALVPQDGDAEVVVRNLGTGAEWRHGVGTRPPQTTNDVDEPGAAAAAPPAAVNITFSSDTRFAVFQIRPTKAELDAARKEKKKPEEMPKDALGIMGLADGRVTRIDRVKSYQLPQEGAGYVAYLSEAKPDAGGQQQPQPAATNRPGQQSPRKEYGTDLVLRSLGSDGERVFHEVLDYSFTRDAKTLVYTVSSKQDESDGLFAVAPDNARDPVPLMKAKGKYTRLTWDDRQTQLAFLSDRDDATAKQPKMKLYRWERGASNVEELVSTASGTFKAGMAISDRAAIDFSNDGARIFFGVAPPAEPAPSADSLVSDEEKVSVDLWNWKDDLIQPMQKVRANQDRNRSYRAVYDRAAKKYSQLADESMEGINAAANDRWAIGTDDRPYRPLVGVEGNYSDFYLVDTSDNSRKHVVKKQNGAASWSPNGKYALLYKDKDWHVVSTSDGKVTNLTSNRLCGALHNAERF